MVQVETKRYKKKQAPVSHCSPSKGISHFAPITGQTFNTTLRAAGQRLVEDPHDRQAYQNYRTLLERSADPAAGYNDLAIAMTQLGRLDWAQACFCRAIAFDPGQAHFFNNLGRLLRDRGRTEEAIGFYRDAVQLQPDYANAQWNLSLSLLATGRFIEGWQRFTWRKHADLEAILDSHRQTQEKLWQGETFHGRRLLIRYEQGCGDNIQMARYLPLVKARGGTVLMETQSALCSLFQDLPGADTVIEAASDGKPTVEFDLCTFALDLPRIFKTELNTIPAPLAYLKSDPDKHRQWQVRLIGPEKKIGIVWAGSPRHSNDKKRSCSLDHFASLADLENMLLFSLQVGANSQTKYNNHRIVDLGSYIRDFSDTAAIISNLDLVISVDTAVLHLAGALGRPVWGLLPYVADWRWLLNRSDSPWYPSMRLFRQPHPDDWGSVFNAVQRELSSWASRS